MNKVNLEIITPEQIFYSGEIVSCTVETCNGMEGFLKNHSECCMLLPEKSRVLIRENGSVGDGSVLKEAALSGGYVEIKESFTIFTEEAKWKNN